MSSVGATPAVAALATLPRSLYAGLATELATDATLYVEPLDRRLTPCVNATASVYTLQPLLTSGPTDTGVLTAETASLTLLSRNTVLPPTATDAPCATPRLTGDTLRTASHPPAVTRRLLADTFRANGRHAKGWYTILAGMGVAPWRVCPSQRPQGLGSRTRCYPIEPALRSPVLGRPYRCSHRPALRTPPRGTRCGAHLTPRGRPYSCSQEPAPRSL